MRRGTTPQITLHLDISPADFKDIFITLSCPRHTVEKTNEDIVINVEEKTLTFELSQEETLLFNCQDRIKMQVRATLHSCCASGENKAIASNIILTDFGEIVKEGVI